MRTPQKFIGSFAKLRKATIGIVMSVRMSARPPARPLARSPARPLARSPAWNNSAPTGRIFMKFCIWGFFENLSRKCEFQCNRTRIKGTLREDQCTIFLISRSLLPRMRNVSHKSCRECKIRILCPVTVFENRAVYEIMRKNSVERGRPQMTIWHTRIVCWIPKATNTHPQAVQ